MKEKYYKPEIQNAPELNIPDEDTKDSPIKSLEVGKKIKVKLDSDVIIQRVSHDLYSSWTSGLRELYNNEARACRTTKRDYPESNPEIHVKINPHERQLVIHGVDSQGITSEIFENVLGVLGVSSNHDGSEIGQYGMGFASYTTLFESMIVETFARETNEKWSVLADAGVEFKVLPQPKIKNYGTRLTGTFSERIDVDEMIDEIKTLSMFANVITFVELTEDTYNYSAGKIYCQGYKDGMEYLDGMLAENFSEGDNKRKEIKFIHKISVQRDDFDFFGFLMCHDSGYGNVYKYDLNSDHNQTLLLGTPIKADLGYEIPDAVSGYFLNIKDERKYKPTADRDRMTDESIEDILIEIEKELTKEYEAFKLEDIADYKERMKTPMGNVYSSNVWHDINKIVHDELTTDIVNVMNESYTSAPLKRYVSLQELFAVKKGGKPQTVIAIKGLRKELMNRLDQHFPSNRTYIRLDERRNSENRFDLLRQLGVVFGEEYIREHKLTLKRKKGDSDHVNVRMWGTRSHNLYGCPTKYWEEFVSHTVGDINTNKHKFLMRVKTNDWGKVHARYHNTHFVIMKDRKGFDDSVLTLDQHMKIIADTMFYYKDKEMTLKDIIELPVCISPTRNISGKATINLIELKDMTIEELDSDTKDNIFITPVGFENKKEKDWNLLSSRMYMYLRGGNSCESTTDTQRGYEYDLYGSCLNGSVGKQLELKDFDVCATNKTDNTATILRLTRKIKDENLLMLARELLSHHETINYKVVEEAVYNIEEKLN